MSITAVSQLFFGLSRYLDTDIEKDAQRGFDALIAILVEDSEQPDVAFTTFIEHLRRSG